jgi:hypothetical protein
MRCVHLFNFTFIEIDTNRQAAKTEAGSARKPESLELLVIWIGRVVYSIRTNVRISQIHCHGNCLPTHASFCTAAV